jgi:HD-GYP domain-containing protein (c-di-GMP phosphodiesterase class II)
MNTSLESDQNVHDHLVKHIHKLTQIGLALSAEKDIKRLLEMILTEARALSSADAGTLYILDKEENRLRFEILQNDSMGARLGEGGGAQIRLPDVPLHRDGKANYANVSSYVALTGKVVNIPNVYEAEGFDFTGPRKYDAATGYRTESMLVIPMQNHENEIIGVLQLLNARNPETGQVERFSKHYVDIIASLASQAAVSLTNTQLIQELKDLLYAFVQSIGTAIDAKSPYTGGHIKRVVDLTMIIAQKMNESDQAPFRDIHFSADEMEELRLAAWMHDVGKITTPEYVVDKASRLQTIFDRIELVETRFHLIAKSIENSFLQQKVAWLQNGNPDTSLLDRLEKKVSDEIRELYNKLDFLKTLNTGDKRMSPDDICLVEELAHNAYTINGEQRPYLTADEVKNLSILQGTLTRDERLTIENHAAMTLNILKQLPFPRRMARIPEYAGSHHEKLDGTGYPLKLKGDTLSLQSRILAIADIFEALTAQDRPYKQPLKLSHALDILTSMKHNRHIDGDIFDFFVNNRLYVDYARKEMSPAQMGESGFEVDKKG